MHPKKKTLQFQWTVCLRLRRDQLIDDVMRKTYSQENQSNPKPCDTENLQPFSYFVKTNYFA